MDILDFRDYCLSLPFTEETTPFDETTLVFKVQGKMFTLTDMEEFEWIAVKCDPDKAVELREQYEGVSPCYHMNKRHWNGVRTDSDIPEALIREWIKDSYMLVVNGNLTRALREEVLAALDQNQ